MPNPLLDYYKSYYEHNGYSLEVSKGFSRIGFILEYLDKYVNPGARVLDVGCGDMYLAQARPQYEWVGIDINTAKAKGSAIEHDLMETPYPWVDQHFDAVICSEVLEHVWDLRVIHKEIYRLLKPKGLYIMSTPNFDHVDHFITHFREILTDPKQPHTLEHIRFYNAASHQGFLKQAGFNEIERVGADAQYSHFFVQARVALFRELESKGYTVQDMDKLIGRMFPDFSHTILFLSQK